MDRIVETKKYILKLFPLNSGATPRIERSWYKSLGKEICVKRSKMKQFVRLENLVKFNTTNLVNGCRARVEMISSGTPL